MRKYYESCITLLRILAPGPPLPPSPRPPTASLVNANRIMFKTPSHLPRGHLSWCTCYYKGDPWLRVYLWSFAVLGPNEGLGICIGRHWQEVAKVRVGRATWCFMLSYLPSWRGMDSILWSLVMKFSCVPNTWLLRVYSRGEFRLRIFLRGRIGDTVVFKLRNLLMRRGQGSCFSERKHAYQATEWLLRACANRCGIAASYNIMVHTIFKQTDADVSALLPESALHSSLLLRYLTETSERTAPTLRKSCLV